MEEEKEETAQEAAAAEKTTQVNAPAPVPSGTGPAQEFRRVDTTQQTPSSGLYSSKKSGPGKVLLLILGLIVLLAIGTTGYLLRDKFTRAEPAPTPAPELETPVVEPTPTPSFDRNKYTIRVLNGTKTSGLAASEAAKLKELGYQIGKTGNATSSAIAQTTIRLKEEPEGLLDALIKDLSDDYDAIAGKALDETDDL
ncbi:MAG: Uncharacterized protein CEO21_445, partial [Microgenomates group bacterium Gr01-1014_80]